MKQIFLFQKIVLLFHKGFLNGVFTYGLLFLVLFSCTKTSDYKEKTKEFNSSLDFQNVLNLRGIPDSTTDRSVFAFSDQGAWFGYGLPSVTRPELYGSFIGPYLMTQDNGVWIDPVLSQLEIIDIETGKTIQLADAKSIKINSYPGKLKQSFSTKNPELLIESELIFVTARTAIMKLNIENLLKKTRANIN